MNDTLNVQTNVNAQTISPKSIAVSLLLLRLGIAIVFIMWTLDKFINPAHTAAVFKAFYGFDGLSSALSAVLGVVQIIIVIAFTIGFKRTLSYGAILIMHGFSTMISFSRYLDPWEGANLLFFAAFPMLAACIALFILRAHDIYSIDGQKATTSSAVSS